MPTRTPFVLRLLDRLDKLDKEAVQNYLLQLVRENEDYVEILERLPSGVILLEEPGRILFANRQVSEWLGLSPGRPEYVKTLVERVKDRAFAELLSKRLSFPLQHQVDDFHLLTPQEMDLRMVIYPPEEGRTGILFFFNITAEKNRQRENERLVRHESLLRLAAGVAHEIGNPLNSIHIHLGLLREKVQAFPSREHEAFLKTLSVLELETKRLDRIVRNFLKAVRKPPLRFKPEKLNEIIRDAVSFMMPELESAGITVSIRPDKRLPEFFMDRDRLHEVFINLLKNAMEAMPDGGQIRISVSYKGKAVMIRVRDQGTGIPEDVLPHIFDAYFTTKDAGSGLGLMVVYNAIGEHGGRIEVESKPGKGTVFIILLPVRQPKLQLPGSVEKLKQKGED